MESVIAIVINDTGLAVYRNGLLTSRTWSYLEEELAGPQEGSSRRGVGRR